MFPERVELVVDGGGIVHKEPVSVLTLLIKEDWDSPSQFVCDDNNVGDSNRTFGLVIGDNFVVPILTLDDIFISIEWYRIKGDLRRYEINSNIAVTM